MSLESKEAPKPGVVQAVELSKFEDAIWRNDTFAIAKLLPTVTELEVTQGWFLSAWYGHRTCLEAIKHTFLQMNNVQYEDICMKEEDMERLAQIDPSIVRQYYIADATALHLATARGHLECVEFLLDSDPRPKQWEPVNNCPPMIAARFGQVDILRLLLAKTDEHYKPLHIDSFLMVACQSGQAACVRVLHEAGAQMDGNSGGAATLGRKPPMYIAAHNGHIEVLGALVECGASVNGDGRYLPLSGAAIKGSLECVQYLLDHGASIEEVNATGNVLSDAAYGRNLDVVDLFISRGCDVNHTDGSGNTALHMAALRGNAAIVKRLLEAGANPNLKNNTNTLPIHRAIPTLRHGLQSKYLETLKALVRSGSDIRGNFGRPGDVKTYNSPLFKAIRTGQPSVIDVLLIASPQSVIRETMDASLPRGISEDHLQKLTDCVNSVYTLKHLARHTIRAVYFQASAQYICQLPLPQPLIQFINYPEFDEIHADQEESQSVSDS